MTSTKRSIHALETSIVCDNRGFIIGRALMNRDRCQYVSGWLALILSVALIGGIVQCSNAQAFEVTYYYLPG